MTINKTCLKQNKNVGDIHVINVPRKSCTKVAKLVLEQTNADLPSDRVDFPVSVSLDFPVSVRPVGMYPIPDRGELTSEISLSSTVEVGTATGSPANHRTNL